MCELLPISYLVSTNLRKQLAFITVQKPESVNCMKCSRVIATNRITLVSQNEEHFKSRNCFIPLGAEIFIRLSTAESVLRS
jgi:hypothetical protein